MKYLAYFRPDEELCDLILRQDNIVLPKMGLHSTLCRFHMNPEYESELVSELYGVKFSPFEIETLGYGDYDEDSLALRLSCPEELSRLHESIVNTVWNYADEGFEEVVNQYYEEYDPHITISRSSSGFERPDILIGQKDWISRYTLAKKVGEGWEDVKDFYSGG